MTDTKPLLGKTALVTGASRGIGRGIAVALAGAGARVVCVSTTEGGCTETVEKCRAAGAEALAYAVDIGDEAALDACAGTVLQAVTRVDILVNNAGVKADGGFLRMKVADLERVLAVNVRGVFLCCRAFARGMAKARWGRIVNIGSVVGLTGNAGQANYAASKAAVIGLSKSLARELSGRNITVNVVAPGWIETDMTAGLPEDIVAAAQKSIPLGRFGTVQDVAGAVRFLCSDEAAYVTGQIIVIDGGMTM